MTAPQKTRKVQHRPSVVTDHQAYLHDLMAQLDRAQASLRLKNSLRDKGIRNREMAAALQVSERSIEDYVSPLKTVLPFDYLEQWADLTDTTPEWLLYGEKETTKNHRTEGPPMSPYLEQVIDGILEQGPAVIRENQQLLEGMLDELRRGAEATLEFVGRVEALIRAAVSEDESSSHQR